MATNLRKLNEQVMVITGASSGIGLATARLAARQGARVVLSSRDDTDLAQAVEEIRAAGGRAIHVVADVADQAAMQRLAEAAVREFGRIDTWVNNAGVSIFGRIEEVSLADARRLFETNYWGVVNGSLAALPYLKQEGGVLINVGSILSETGYPLQGHYTASKHAVKGFTDSLRIELDKENAPVYVTLIQPAAIDTPYPEHAKSYLEVEPQHVPPVYDPEIVAEAIVHCAERPGRNVLVGGSTKVFTTMEHFLPAAGDRVKAMAFYDRQMSEFPNRREDILHQPRAGDSSVRGHYPGRVMRSSAYTTVRLNRGKAMIGAAAVGAAVLLASRAGWFGERRARAGADEWEEMPPPLM